MMYALVAQGSEQAAFSMFGDGLAWGLPEGSKPDMGIIIQSP